MKSALLSALGSLHQQKIFAPAAGAFALRILGAFFQFLFTVLLARLYGANGVGVFVISLSLLIVFSTIVRWGLDQTTLKLVAANFESARYNSAREILAYSRNFILLSGIAGSVLFMLISDWLAAVFFTPDHSATVLIVMSAAILPVSLTVLFSEALRGLKKVTAYTLLHGTLTPLLSICFVLLLGEHFDGVINGAVAYLCATTVVMLMAISVWYVVSSRLPTSVQQVAINKYEILSTSHSFFWVAIISVVMSFMETFVLGLFHDDVSVGLYAAALRMALIINFIIIAFNSILAPNFAALYRQGRLENIEVQARHSVVVMLTLTLPVVSLYCLLPTQVLSIFGEEFSRASTALIMLSVAQLINVFFGPVGILLQMTGHEKSFRNNVIISAFTTLVSALILIPPYDVIGASISALTGILLLNVLSLISVRRHLGINPLPLSPSSLSSRIDS